MAAVKTRKTAGARKPKAKPASRGPRAETVEMAAKVVKLRDQGKRSWEAIQKEIGCSPSQLRRLYTLGGGKADGARYGAKSKPAPKASGRKRAAAKPKPRARRKRGA